MSTPVPRNYPGSPISPEERATRSSRQLAQNINRSIRTDFGGVPDVVLHIAEELKETGLLGGMPEKDIEKISMLVLKIVRNQIEGVRKRTAHDREELLRRFEVEPETVDVLSSPRLFKLLDTNNKIQKILNWSLYKRQFDSTFIKDVERTFLAGRPLSDRQLAAIDNIIDGFNIDKMPPTEEYWDEDNIPF
jgi:hypothetical protein